MTSYVRRFGKILSNRDGWQCHYCGSALIPVDTPESDSLYFEPPEEVLVKGEVVLRAHAKPRVRRAVVDHKLPRSQGGNDCLENLVLSCWQCNQVKSDRHSYEEFKATQGALL